MLDLSSIPSKARWAGVFVLAVACLYVGLSAYSCIGKGKVEAGTQQANQLHEVMATSAAKGEAYDAQEKATDPKLEAANREIKRLNAKLAKFQAAPLEPVPAPDPAPAVVAGPDAAGGTPGADPAGGDPEKAILRELVQAQDTKIGVLEEKYATMTLSRDSWRASAQAGAQVEVQLRAVIAAKEGLAKAEYWRGFFHGSMAGGVAGGAGGVYLGRRMK